MAENDQITIIPTCVPQSLDDLMAKANDFQAFSTMIHVDIDDGIFTPEMSWPFNEMGEKGSAERGIGGLDISVDNFLMQFHLMVSEGRDGIELAENFIKAGCDSLIVHVESLGDDTDTLGAWAMLGVREVGIAILLDTPLKKLDPLLPFLDFVHILSVATIGAQGAPFDSRALDRVAQLHGAYPDLPIQVDGGICETNIASLVKAGARRFAVGSALSNVPDQAQAYADLKAAAENALQ